MKLCSIITIIGILKKPYQSLNSEQAILIDTIGGQGLGIRGPILNYACFNFSTREPKRIDLIKWGIFKFKTITDAPSYCNK